MKRVFILGASQGIGFGLVKRYLEAGYAVVASSRSGRIDHFAHERLQVVALDLTQATQVAQVASTLDQAGHRFELLINNAGIGPDLSQARPERDSFAQTMAVNLEGIVFATEALLPLLRPDGTLINVSSKMGSIAHCQHSTSVAYRISKAGLNIYSKILSLRLTQKVATIHPGFVRTNISAFNDHAPLSPEDSAACIYDFEQSDFETGVYWDCQENVGLEW